MEGKCYCGSESLFSKCCKPFIEGNEDAPTAEKLMRSRYAAYVIQNADYLLDTTHVSKRKLHSKEDILHWSKSNQWIKLEILHFSEDSVEFKAFYIDNDLRAQVHHEKSLFKKEIGKWFYVDGQFYS
mgnify:FL=1